jgi:hypothetical protein
VLPLGNEQQPIIRFCEGTARGFRIDQIGRKTNGETTSFVFSLLVLPSPLSFQSHQSEH